MYSPEASKARRDYLRSRKRCTNCGKQDELTLNGRSRCEACREREIEYSRKNHRRIRERNNISCAQRRARKKAEGLCGVCGREKICDRSIWLCEKCLTAQIRKQKEYTKRKMNKE